MKTKLFVVTIILLSITLNAQQIKGITGETNWLTNWTNFKPGTTQYNETNQILTGSITQNLKLTKDNTYRLIGTVYVTNNAVLTIEPGTVIRGDKESCGTLVITKGSKIMAEGTATSCKVNFSGPPNSFAIICSIVNIILRLMSCYATS